MAKQVQVYDYLLEAAQAQPDGDALEFMGKPITFAALAHNALRLASGLSAYGIERGASVGLMLPNLPQFPEALYGGWMHGNVVVPMNVLLRSAEIRYFVDDSALRALFIFEPLLPQVEEAIADMANPPTVFVVGKPGKHIPYAALIEGHTSATPVRAGDDAHILTIYTSGTTGRPKGAVITNRNVIAQLDMTDAVFTPLPGDRGLCVLPLFHVFALNAVLNANIRNRSTVVLHPKFEVGAALNSLQNERITVFCGVPTMYFYLLKQAGPEVQFPQLRHCISGGAAMPVDVLRNFEERFKVPIYEGYGLTETTVSVCCNSASAKRIGSVGKPHPGVELKIVDDEGHVAKPGERGEILAKGANIMRCYLNRPKETNEALVDGWLKTGDIGYIDEDGFLFIVDRKKDLIIKGGYNIYPREIEEVLYQLPQIAEAAVVGVEDEAKGEQVRAVISVRPGQALDRDAIEAYLGKNLAKYKLPSEYVFLPDLPKGPTGKILKRALRAH